MRKYGDDSNLYCLFLLYELCIQLIQERGQLKDLNLIFNWYSSNLAVPFIDSRDRCADYKCAKYENSFQFPQFPIEIMKYFKVSLQTVTNRLLRLSQLYHHHHYQFKQKQQQKEGRPTTPGHSLVLFVHGFRANLTMQIKRFISWRQRSDCMYVVASTR